MKAKKWMAVMLAGVMLAATALSGCADKEIDKEATVLTVNDTELSLGFVNFVARFEQAQRDAFYVAYMGDGVWQSDTDGDGQTLEDTTKAEIMTMIQEWLVLEDVAADYGVAVSDDMKAQIKITAEKFMADNPEETIAQLGATQEYVEQMLYYEVLESQIQETIEGKATVNVSTAEAAQRTFSYILLTSRGETNKETGLYEVYDEDTMAEKVKEAEDMAKRAHADFDAVAKELKQEDSTYSYGVNETNMDAALIEAADALKEGEVSGLVEGANGYFVIRLDSEFDEEATEKEKTSLIAAQRVAYYEGIVADLIEAAQIQLDEKLWKTVKFDSLFTYPTEETTTK